MKHFRRRGREPFYPDVALFVSGTSRFEVTNQATIAFDRNGTCSLRRRKGPS
jgi:hypothetical protein